MAAMSRLMRSLTYALAGALVVSVLAVVFHDAIFRWMTLRLVQQVPGLDVGFDGRFDVSHAFPLTLDAEGVRLAFKGEALEGTRSRFGKLHLEIRPWTLLRGVVYIEQLTIADADVDIPPLPASTTTAQPTTGIRIPFIEELALERVKVRFQLEPDTKRHELNVSHLKAGAGENGELKANGTASLNGDGLELTAAFGSVEQFLRPTRPFPVNATLRASSLDLDIRVSGTLDEPLRGGGAQLDVRATTSNVSPLRDVFLPHAPFGGAVDANARINGDLHAPALSDLNLGVDDGDRLRLTIGGKVANLRILEGLDLQVEAISQDPTVTRYLTRDAIPAARTIQLRAGVRGDADDYRIEVLEAEISGASSLSVGASGKVHLSDLKSEWPLKAADLDLHLSGGVASFKAWLPEAVPRTGAVRVKAHIDGSAESLTFNNVDIALDKTEPVRGTMRGELAYTVAQLEAIRAGGEPSADVWIPATADVILDLATADLKSLSTLLGEDLPDLGPVSAKARLRRNGDAIEVTQLDAHSTGKGSLSLATTGRLTIGGITSKQSSRDAKLESAWPLEEAHLDVQLSAAVADLKAWLPEGVLESGALRAKARIDGSAESLAFNNVEVVLDKTRPLRGTMRGQIAYTVNQLVAIRAQGEPPADALIPADVDVTLDLATADLKSLSIFLGEDLPDLGPISAKARLRRDGDAIEVTKLDARTTGKRPLSLTAKGQLAIAEITSKQSLRDVDLELQAKGRNAESVAHITGSLPIDPGPWSLQARVEKKSDKLRVEALKFESGRADTVRVELNGKIADLESLIASAGKSPAGVILEGHVAAASTEQLTALIGKPVPDLGRFEARFDARGEQDDWSVSTATVAITDEAGLDFKATGKASQLLRNARFDTKLELRIPDPKRTVARIGGSIPQMSAITADGRLEGGLKQGSFNGRIDLGSTQLKTQLEVELLDPRPRVAGTISTPVLRLGDFLAPGPRSNDPTGEPATSDAVHAEQHVGIEERLLSDQPLRFDLLHHADVDLKLIADKIEGEHIRTERLELNFSVVNGRLKAHHKKLKHEDKRKKHEGGAVSTALEIDNAVDPPKVSIKGRANHISLGALHAQVSNSPQLLEGRFSFDVDVTGSGRSPHELMSTLNGRYGHVMEDVKLTGGDIDLLAFNAIQLLTATVVSKKHTTIDCAIGKFKVRKGVATSETLFLHTPKMIATGTGHLDFNDETVDILVNTEAKKLLLKKKTVLRIYGSMEHLKIDANLKERALGATAGIAVMVALPPLGFSMAGLSYLEGFIKDGEKSPCIPTE